MTLRADHVSGAAFVAFGLLIIALSGDLPFGSVAMPGAGFMPMLISVLTIVLGFVLMARGRESPPLASIRWGDAKHAGLVLLITAAAVALYEWLGFIITMILLMAGLLIAIERKAVVRSLIFGVSVTLATWFVFAYVLRTPLAEGPFGF